MKRYNIEIVPAAVSDLETLWRYIEDVNPPAADRILMQIEKRIQTLETLPERGVQRSDIAKSARCLVERDYLILYEVVGDVVRIVRVVHGAFDLTKI